MWPSSATAVENSRSMSSCTVTLQAADATGAPASSASSSAASARRRSWASLIRTVAPSSMHRRATAEPMPVPAAAVTTTVRPSSRRWPST